MLRPRMGTRWSVVGIIGTLVAAWPATAAAQDAAARPFSNEQLEQIVAPIALYPDALLAQVLMASTYPLEVVEAARFAKENPKLEGDALNQALQEKTWDDSVKSLVSFPQVLEMMNEKLDWTQKLGDAVLAQQSDVMDSVQRLRAKAKAEGNLETTEQQKVVVEPAPAPPPEVVVEQAPPTIIKIEQSDPQVVYVPSYDPTVVYGPWPYPAYPPYAYYPPGYVAGTALLSFGIGMAVGGALWGDCGWGWGNGDIDVDIDHHNEFNRNVNKNVDRGKGQGKFQNGKWQHDSSHRKGAQYRDKATQQRFDKAGPRNAASREAFRGRAEQGRQQIAREGTAGMQRDVARSQSGGARDRAAGQQRPSAARDRAPTPPRSAGSLDRGRGSGAFQGVGHGSEVRRDSSRGYSSRSSSMGSRGGGSRGGSRGGGGRPRR